MRAFLAARSYPSYKTVAYTTLDFTRLLNQNLFLGLGLIDFSAHMSDV